MESNLERTKQVDLKQEHIHIGVLVFKRTNDQNYILERFTEDIDILFKLSMHSGSITGKNIKELFPGILGDMMLERVNKGWKKESGYSDPIHVKTTKGESINLDLLFLKINHEYIQVTITDIGHTKKAYGALINSEKKFRNLFETMTKGVVYQDNKGFIISVNPAAEEILELTADQLYGKTSTDKEWGAIKEDGSAFQGHEHPSMMALQTGKPVYNVVMGLTLPKSKKIKWILIDAIPEYNPGESKPYQVFTTFSDITQIKNIEKSLEESNQHLISVQEQLQKSNQQLIESNNALKIANDEIERKNINLQDKQALLESVFKAVPIGIGMENNGIILFINQKFSKITGYKPMDILGKEMDTLFANTKDYESVEEDKEKQLKSTGTALVQTQVKHKNGQTIYVKIHATAVKTESIHHNTIFTLEDITDKIESEHNLKRKNEELQAAEEELRAINDELLGVNEKLEKRHTELQDTYKKLALSEEKFRELAENINDVFWLIEDETIIYLSKAFEKIWGYSCDSLIKNPSLYKEWLHAEDKELFKIFYTEDDFKEVKSISQKYRIIKPDKSIRWIWSRAFPIYDDGKFTRVAVISSDITDQKEIEQALLNAKQKAQESDNLKSSFLANISHEIRTPLNGIVGFSGLLNNENLDKQTRTNYIGIITKSTEQLIRIIDDIVDLSKIEAGQLKIIKNKCDILKVLEDSNLFFTNELEKRNKGDIILSYSADIDPDKSVITIDEARVRQVLNNLIDNAIKYTKQGEIHYSAKITDNNKFIEFLVSDTGVGIDHSKFDIIFERFRQVDEGHTRKYGGTGLGLPICKGLLWIMGGDIWLESKPGEGSKFFFTIPYIPIKAVIEENDTGEFNEDDLDWSAYKFLLVEDDAFNYDYLEAILEPTGVAMERAATGVKAVEAIQKESYDLILMDIRLPDLNGFEATKIIRQKGISTPIIAQTAYAMPEDKQSSFEAGCDDYIAKPIDTQLLLVKIARLLAKNS